MDTVFCKFTATFCDGWESTVPITMVIFVSIISGRNALCYGIVPTKSLKQKH